MDRRGTRWRWLVPAHGRIWTDRPFLAQRYEDFPPTAPPASAPALDALLRFDMLQVHADAISPTQQARSAKDKAIATTPALDALLRFSVLNMRANAMETALQLRPLEDEAAVPSATLLALVVFAASESPAIPNAHRSPIERFLLRYDRRLGAVLKHFLPQSSYQKLRLLYPQLLRRLTRPQR